MAIKETLIKFANKPFKLVKHDSQFLEMRLELIEIFNNKDIELINALIERYILLEYMFIKQSKALGD